MEIHFIANEAHAIVLCAVVFLLVLSGVFLHKSEELDFRGFPGFFFMVVSAGYGGISVILLILKSL